MTNFSEHGVRPAMTPETYNVCFDPVLLLFSAESEQYSSPGEPHPIRGGGFGSVVWTTDSSRVGMRFLSRLGEHRNV
jgi:hypothetical protein